MSNEDKNEDPMIGDILSSIKSIINENEDEPTEVAVEEAVETPEPEPISVEPEDDSPEPALEMPSMDMEESILSTATASLGTQQFVKLNNMIRMGNSNVTLSDITRSLLRPMLREWLDENLPNMVERMVEYEIKRLVNRIEDNK